MCSSIVTARVSPSVRSANSGMNACSKFPNNRGGLVHATTPRDHPFHGCAAAIPANKPGVFRPDEAWPNDAHQLQRNSLMFAYASPVHKQTGLIGDFACSLYRGSDESTSRKSLGCHDVDCRSGPPWYFCNGPRDPGTRELGLSQQTGLCPRTPEWGTPAGVVVEVGHFMETPRKLRSALGVRSACIDVGSGMRGVVAQVDCVRFFQPLS